MNKKVFLIVGAVAIALLLGLLVFGPGATSDVDAQGLVEYQLFFFQPNAFEVNGVSFWSNPVESNAWKETTFSGGCNHWRTDKALVDTEAWVQVLPGNDLLGALGASTETVIFLKLGPDKLVTICDRMLHVPQLEGFAISDPENPPPFVWPPETP